MAAKRIATWLISLAVLTAVGAGVYSHLHAKASNRVKVEMLQVADDMTLETAERDTVRRLIAAAHDAAFDLALDLTRTHGRKFDERVYFDAVFDQVVTRARGEGLVRLADKVDRQRQHFSFNVAER